MMDHVVPKDTAVRKTRRRRRVRRVTSAVMQGFAAAGCAWGTVPCMPYVSYEHTETDDETEY